MHPPLPPPILSTVRLFADHAPTLLSLFILSNSRSRAILVESSKYLKILRLFFTYNRSEFFLSGVFFFFSRSSKIYAYVDISRRSGARRPSPARRKREIRGDMSLVFTRKDPPVRGGDRFRRAKSTMSSDVLERERKEKRKKGDR